MGFYAERILPHLLGWATSGLDDDRRRVASQARGRVLELGAGSGANFGYYREDSTVLALEPSWALLGRAAQAPVSAATVHLIQGDGLRLPLGAGSIDSVVAYLVFCTVPGAEKAARELHRVLAPGGRLIFFEHVLSDDPATARWQRRLTPLWKRVTGGCSMRRRTPSILAGAGFRLEERHDYVHPRMTKWFPICEGVAVKSPRTP